ncbi:MAG: hypothetical protein ACYTDY_03815 [Planctomycetota bacterium]|jgi:hypothetical protein
MAHAYTPGLRVSDFTLLTKERRLPLLGEVLVGEGDRVTHDQVIARTNLPGDVQSMNVAHRLSIEASDLPHFMLKKEGETIEKGEVIAESRSFFGFFKTRCESPFTGTIETLSTVTGQALLREPPIPVEVKAYLDGIVTEVHPEEGATVETWGAFIQGIFGVGGETNGEIRVVASGPGDILTPDRIPSSAPGQVLVGGSRITMEAIDKAREAGARGIIAGGFDDQDLTTLLGIELGVAITGHEELGVTLVLTEGFGEIAMADRTFGLLKENEGQKASINGATQIRAGVIRPEIVIPKLDMERPGEAGEGAASLGLREGSRVRVIREPNFGNLGHVTALPPELQAMECETKVRVLRVKLDTGEEYLLPRANVEMIES